MNVSFHDSEIYVLNKTLHCKRTSETKIFFSGGIYCDELIFGKYILVFHADVLHLLPYYCLAVLILTKQNEERRFLFVSCTNYSEKRMCEENKANNRMMYNSSYKTLEGKAKADDRRERAVVLSIAGSDPSGGAGIQADVKAISALGVYAAAAITAVTVQNTCGVSAVYSLPPAVVGAQVEAVLEDLRPDALKIGMIDCAATASVLSEVLRKYAPPVVVYDPVMISTSGNRLMEAETLEVVRSSLFPLLTLVTPNLCEAEVLAGCSVRTVHDMREVARWLNAQYGCAFLVKGGHLSGDEMCDVLCDGHGNIEQFTAPRVDSGNLHGTGCTLSAGIAACLAQGDSLRQSVKRAKRYVSGCIGAGRDLHIGKGNGPLWHFPVNNQPADKAQ